MSTIHMTRSNQQGHAVLFAVLAVIVIGGIGFAGWQVSKHHKKATTTTSVQPVAATTATSTTPSAINTASLNADLQSANTSVTQESTDANSANTAVNDQQSEVTVPTN